MHLKYGFCSPEKGAFYAYAYIIYTQYMYNKALNTYVNLGTYMHPHWKLLHPLCSWSGYGSGDQLV
jgi:hypothetical protein